MFLRKVSAFIKRDFFIQTSYKLSFVLTWLGILSSTVIFYFVAKLFGKGATAHLADYGGDYFSFVIIGIAFSGYLSTALRSLSENLRSEQMTGTLEAILMTPTKISTIMISMSIWNFIFCTLSVIFYFFLGIILLGRNFIIPNFFNALLIVFLTMVCFGSIGIISASFIILFKKGDPLVWAISTFSTLFGGVYFPVSILPKGLQIISNFLPITYSLRALRFALLKGYQFRFLAHDIIALGLFSIFLLPLSIIIFKYAIRKAKSDGSLSFY